MAFALAVSPFRFLLVPGVVSLVSWPLSFSLDAVVAEWWVARKPSLFASSWPLLVCLFVLTGTLIVFTALKRLRDSANANDVETGECAE